jgi:two-component system CheB/CheR fusion protein
VLLAIGLVLIPDLGRGLGAILFFAVLVSAWYGGLGPGLLATALATVIAVLIFTRFGLRFETFRIVGLCLFVAGGVLISLLVEALHAARRRVEASEQWLSAVLKSVGDAVIATDAQGRVTFMNPIAQSLTGWVDDAAAGQLLENVFRIVCEDTRQPIENPVSKVIQTGLIVGLGNHTVLIGRDGKERPIDDSAAPIKNDKGQIVGVVLVFRDVTERRLWEDALRKSEERHRIMTEQVKEYAIFTLDPAGHATTWNAGVQRLLGFAESEFIGQHFSRTYRPEDVSQGDPENELKTAMAEGQAARDCWQGKQDGTRFWASGLTTALRDEHGNLVGFTKVLRDLTDLKRAEEERAALLARAQAARAEAEAANQAKDQFLAVLSHELRTPLTPVLMTVSALLDDPETSAAMRPTLEMTRHNVELEARLIDDLLDITRIVRGKMPLNREVIDAHALLHRTLEICREDIRSGDLQVTLDLSAAEHHVFADAARLQQVFWNLIKNSVKFTPPGGKLSIRTLSGGHDELDSFGHHLILEVADTGIGIEHDLLPRIFDAFEQGGALARDRRMGGLGLGLAISRSIVEAHGGRLTAASAGPYQGTTFTLQLSAVSALTTAIPEPTPTVYRVAQGRGLRLLLVEDDESTLRVMAKLLRDRQYKVTTANTIASALEIAAAQDFDLVISDIGLPDGNGLELMKKLKNQRIIKGIALSGFGMDEDIQKSQEAGFVAHLTKPIDFQKLEATIQRVSSSTPTASAVEGSLDSCGTG